VEARELITDNDAVADRRRLALVSLPMPSGA
jgi:hypothetical protein